MALGFALLKRGIKTPLPVVFAEKRKGLFLRENYLVTLGIEPLRPVGDLLNHIAVGERRRNLLCALGKFVRHSHDIGFYHDDMSTAHIFADNDPVHPSFAFIDLDNGRLLKSVSLGG